MCSRFSSSVAMACAGLVLFLAGSLRTAASAQSLTASVATDRGCGAGALYNIGEPDQILYSVSRSASVTLRLQRPDGTVSTFLANQPLVGGVTYAIHGVIGNPPGQRLLTLDAMSGGQMAHKECTYTARAAPSTLAATLQTNRGCGAGAVFSIGEPNTFFYSVSQSALVTLRLIRPDGTVSTFLANQPVSGGVTHTIHGIIGNPPGQRRLILDAVAGSQTAHVECAYTAQGAASGLTATLQTNRGCGAGALYTLGEPILFSFSVSQTALVTLTLVRPDGTTSILVPNQFVPGGVPRQIQGIIGNPLGQRRLILDAVAGAQTAHVQCTYTAEGTAGGSQRLTLSINKGCGGQYHPGDPFIVTYGASVNANLTLIYRRDNGTQFAIFTNRPVLGGQTYIYSATIGNGMGGRTLILQSSPAAPGGAATCGFTIVP